MRISPARPAAGPHRSPVQRRGEGVKLLETLLRRIILLGIWSRRAIRGKAEEIWDGGGGG